MLLEEFVPMLEREHALGADGNKRGMLGWSMGGYGAIRATERAPQTFAAVAAASPAIFTSYSAIVSHAFDDSADFAANDVIAMSGRLSSTPVRIDCGTGDPFHPADVAFAGALPRRPEGDLSSKGCHNGKAWRAFAPGQVDFFGRWLAS